MNEVSAAWTVEGSHLVASVPLEFRRRGGRKEVIAPDGSDIATPRRPKANNAIVIALARAYAWQEALEDGRFATIRELASTAGLDHSYAARILRITSLAPDIVEAIIDGEEPDGRSLGKLYRLPAIWHEQRRAL